MQSSALIDIFHRSNWKIPNAILYKEIPGIELIKEYDASWGKCRNELFTYDKEEFDLYNGGVTVLLSNYFDKDKDPKFIAFELYTLTLLKKKSNKSNVSDFFENFCGNKSLKALQTLTDKLQKLPPVNDSPNYNYFEPISWPHSLWMRPSIGISLLSNSDNSDASKSTASNPSDITSSVEASSLIFNYRPGQEEEYNYTLKFNNEEINKLFYKLFKSYSFIKNSRGAGKEKYEPFSDDEINAKEIEAVSANVLKLLKLVLTEMENGIVDRNVRCNSKNNPHLFYRYYFDLFLSTFHLDDEINGAKYKRMNRVYEVDGRKPEENNDDKKSSNDESNIFNAIFHTIVTESREFPQNSNAQLPSQVVLVLTQAKSEGETPEKDESKKGKQGSSGFFSSRIFSIIIVITIYIFIATVVIVFIMNKGPGDFS